VIPIERALEITLAAAAERSTPDRMPAEGVALDGSLGRILREDILADSDYPRFDKAIRDGFAVRFEDTAVLPAALEVLGVSRAGQSADVVVRSGVCCEIMTGARLPDGANAVVMVEHTEAMPSSRVRILRTVREGEGLLRRAAELRAGEKVLASGKQIGLGDIGVLASVGKSEVRVSKKPRVAILATGDELVDVVENPDPDQIRNSNSHTLFAQVAAAGAEPLPLGIGRDNVDDLRMKIREGLKQDILLVSGGVSMGKYDFVEDVFAEFGVRVLFDSVAMKPGKPTVFGIRDQTFVFGLPGNPVSTIVAFRMFVVPVIQSLLKVAGPAMGYLRARLEEPAKCDAGRTAIVPALVHFDGQSYRIRTASWKGSSDLAGLSRANAMVVLPKVEGVLNPGEWVEFLPLEGLCP
jgi:molybdopterin molybdotransferase